MHVSVSIEDFANSQIFLLLLDDLAVGGEDMQSLQFNSSNWNSGVFVGVGLLDNDYSGRTEKKSSPTAPRVEVTTVLSRRICR